MMLTPPPGTNMTLENPHFQNRKYTDSFMVDFPAGHVSFSGEQWLSRKVFGSLQISIKIGYIPRNLQRTDPPNNGPRALNLSMKIATYATHIGWVVATQIFCIINPNFGEDLPILAHIFQMGRNHQLVGVRWDLVPLNSWWSRWMWGFLLVVTSLTFLSP